MGDTERDFTTGAWVEILYGVIPERRLNDCYLHAMRVKTDSFPIEPSDLCNAWKEIRQSEMAQPVNPGNQLTHGLCEKCHNTGNEIVVKDGIAYSRVCNHERRDGND